MSGPLRLWRRRGERSVANGERWHAHSRGIRQLSLSFVHPRKRPFLVSSGLQVHMHSHLWFTLSRVHAYPFSPAHSSALGSAQPTLAGPAGKSTGIPNLLQVPPARFLLPASSPSLFMIPNSRSTLLPGYLSFPSFAFPWPALVPLQPWETHIIGSTFQTFMRGAEGGSKSSSEALHVYDLCRPESGISKLEGKAQTAEVKF